jgi:hypothetical protein
MLEDVATRKDNKYVCKSLMGLELTGSSVSVSVSPAQSSPGVVQMGLSRTRGPTFSDTIPKRRFRKLWLLMLLLEDSLDPISALPSSSVSEESMCQ